MVYMHIDKAKLLKLLRGAVNKRTLKQADIARSTGLNQSQVSRLLRGKFERRTEGLNALCTFLEVPIVNHNTDLPFNTRSELAACLAVLLDGTQQKERAVIGLLKSASKLRK